jgi:Tfp pilus assembly protein PilW
MSLPHNKSVTLLELLIALVILSAFILVFSNIVIFSRYHVVTAARRAQVQNEVSLVLEHMNKQISRAIGNEAAFGVNSVVNTGSISGNTAVRVFIDQDGDGQRNLATDRWIAYRFQGTTGANAGQLRYCPQCSTAACITCVPAWGTADNTIGRLISGFVITKPALLWVPNVLSENWLEVQITGCWDSDGVPSACGTSDNPAATMRMRIKMPSVSTN